MGILLLHHRGCYENLTHKKLVHTTSAAFRIMRPIGHNIFGVQTDALTEKFSYSGRHFLPMPRIRKNILIRAFDTVHRQSPNGHSWCPVWVEEVSGAGRLPWNTTTHRANLARLLEDQLSPARPHLCASPSNTQVLLLSVLYPW